MARGWQSSTAIRPNLTIWPTSSCARTSVRCLRPSSRASAANPNSHHIAARVFANFGFKSGTRIIDFASVPLIPRFASSVPQGRANLGIGTLAGGKAPAEAIAKWLYVHIYVHIREAAMTHVSYTELRAHLAKYMDEVCDS